jgi:hypothetical protein
VSLPYQDSIFCSAHAVVPLWNQTMLFVVVPKRKLSVGTKVNNKNKVYFYFKFQNEQTRVCICWNIITCRTSSRWLVEWKCILVRWIVWMDWNATITSKTPCVYIRYKLTLTICYAKTTSCVYIPSLIDSNDLSC